MLPLTSPSGIKHNISKVDLLPFELTSLLGMATATLYQSIQKVNRRFRISSFCPGVLILSPQEPF